MSQVTVPAASPRSWVAWALAPPAFALAWRLWIIHAASLESCVARPILHTACPTCGMTRALVALSHGQYRASMTAHPWAAALVLQLVIGWLLTARWNAGHGPRPDRWIPHAVSVNAIALVLIWVVRLATGTLPP